ncbi:MAG: 5'-deoxynucleotidase [Oscillospiraceae bacterium]|jgi:5'-deoxynucleotidase|nr:5'-deoxynucleotidase [Oscillospiraceae bacterium]
MEDGYSFFALISRLKYVTRWALMRNSDIENVREHSHMVAVIAHALAVIRRDVFKRDADPGEAAIAALYHDAPEIFTGDMPTPVKYHNDAITAAYREVEAVAAERLSDALPPELRGAFAPYFDGADAGTEELVKAADKLAAYIKCLEELGAGNREFSLAARQTRAKLDALHMAEVEYFIERFIPAFEHTLDQQLTIDN